MKLTESILAILEAKIPEDDKGREKYLKTKGKILTFKKELKIEKPNFPSFITNVKKTTSQVIVDKIEKIGDKVKIVSPNFETPFFDNMKDLIDSIDWDWMSKNVTK